jgi:hypothetical protein
MQSVNGWSGGKTVCQSHTIRPYTTLGIAGILAIIPSGIKTLKAATRRSLLTESVSDSRLLARPQERLEQPGSVASANNPVIPDGTALLWRRSSAKLSKPTRTGGGLSTKKWLRSGAYAKVLLSRYLTARIGTAQ